MALLINGLEERFLGWMTGFEFHLTPPIIKQIKHFRMQWRPLALASDLRFTKTTPNSS